MQNELFHDDIYSALHTAIEALGGYKQVAGWLFINKPVNTAYAHLKNCMRDDKPEKLNPHELILIMQKARDAGVHDVMNYIAAATNYKRPGTLEPHDELAELQRQFISTAKDIEKLGQRIERAQKKVVAE